MVYIDLLAKRQSQRIESRVSRCSVEQVGPAEYRVNCNEEGKTDKRVTLGLLGERGIAVCVDWESGKACEANRKEIPCCHAVKAYREFEGGVEQETKEAA